jgi:hypothetical protein
MTDAVAVIELESHRRRKASSGLLFVEVRLGEDFSIEMSLHDSTRVVGTLKYGLTVKSPKDFDMNELRAAWARWREASEVVA